MNDQHTKLETAKQALHQLIEQLEQLNKNNTNATPLKILLTFRSDYDGLNTTWHCRLRSRDNWFKVSAFFSGSSQFLQNGMREISQEHVSHTLQSVMNWKTEKAYIAQLRWILLILLMNSNVSASKDMNKLIQQFFNDLVHDRKHGGNLRLILPVHHGQDTKQPVNIARMAEKSRLPVSAIVSSLNFLAEKGLAKPLDAKNSYWELSHDFIARKISPVLNQYRTPLRLRLAKHSIAISFGLWATCVGGVSLFALKPNQNVPLIVEQIVPLNGVGKPLETSETAGLADQADQKPTSNKRAPQRHSLTPFPQRRHPGLFARRYRAKTYRLARCTNTGFVATNWPPTYIRLICPEICIRSSEILAFFHSPTLNGHAIHNTSTFATRQLPTLAK